MSINQTALDSYSFETSSKQDMEKTLQALINDYQKVRTGRASAKILDDIYVHAYDTKMKLTEVANVTTPEPKTIMVKPFDMTLLPVIEKAILTAGLGLNPMNDGKLIRIPIPPLSEERRKEIVKQVKQRAEEAKVAMRQHRRETLQNAKNVKTLTEDDMERLDKSITALTSEFNQKIDKVFKAKEEELLTI